MKQTVMVKNHLYLMFQLNGLSGSLGPSQSWMILPSGVLSPFSYEAEREASPAIVVPSDWFLAVATAGPPCMLEIR